MKDTNPLLQIQIERKEHRITKRDRLSLSNFLTKDAFAVAAIVLKSSCEVVARKSAVKKVVVGLQFFLKPHHNFVATN